MPNEKSFLRLTMGNCRATNTYIAQLDEINKLVKHMTHYETQKLLELSFAAYRVNKGYVKQTRRYSEGQPTTFANKELIAYTAHGEWKPDDFVALEVTDADRAAKVAADKHMRRYTMLAMGDLPDFEKDLFEAYCSETQPVGRLGLLAYLPAFVDREIENKIYKQRIKTEFGESKHLEVDRLEPTEVEILKVIHFSASIDYDAAYMHFGAIGKDLVCFTKKEKYAVGKTYDIVGRVKSKDKERDSGLPMTKLNYVKIKEQEV